MQKILNSKYKFKAHYRLLLLLGLIGLCFFASSDITEVVRQALSEAYIAVSTFVAVTLGVFYFLEHALKLDTDTLLNKHPKWHVPIAALMGAMPGCGGAIIVITQYVSGRLGFGSVVAVLTSTMGDAAFLLLAREPKTALIIYAMSIVVGTISGYIVERIHGHDFLRSERKTKSEFAEKVELPNVTDALKYPWLLILIPGLALGLGNAFQADTNLWFGSLGTYDPTLWIGFCGAFLSFFMWSFNPNAGPSIVNLSGKMTETKGFGIHFERVVIDTNFVTVWVIFAFIAFELLLLLSGINLEAVFKVWAPLLPMIAVLIGFIPGCGPQVLVTTFYLNGIIPLSAQIGNAISNDGDALFPAIALAPRAAILATAYTAIPALLVAYGWYFLME